MDHLHKTIAPPNVRNISDEAVSKLMSQCCDREIVGVSKEVR